MSLLVQKFGGTSVGSLERIQTVATQVAKHQQQGHSLIIVVSAMSGETDRLLRLAYQLNPKPGARELASLITTGEQVSAGLLALSLNTLGIRSQTFTGTQAGIVTDQHHLAARIAQIDTQHVTTCLEAGQVAIVAGFQGVTENGEITALGRGGSDTSAVALAAAFKAHECQIYTDVDGIYTADPRLVPKAYRLDTIAMPSMLELASLGAKVLQLRSVEIAGKYHVPLRVLSSFHEGAGTLIDYMGEDTLEAPVIVGLAHKLNLTRYQLNFSEPAFENWAMLLEKLTEAHITVEHVSHVPGQLTQLNLYVSSESAAVIAACCDFAVQNSLLASWHVTPGLARLALVGQGMRSQITTLQRFFQVLKTEKIHWQDFFSSELALSIILPEEHLTQTAQALHQSFFENEHKL
jgi:aspartate kinase